METNERIQKLIQIDYCLKNYAYLPIKKEDCLELFEDYCSEDEFSYIKYYLELRQGEYCGLFVTDILAINEKNDEYLELAMYEDIFTEKLHEVLRANLSKIGIVLDASPISDKKHKILSEMRDYKIHKHSYSNDVVHEVFSTPNMSIEDMWLEFGKKIREYDNTNKKYEQKLERQMKELEMME